MTKDSNPKPIIANPIFWIAAAFAVFYISATLIYQFVPLPGVVSGPLFVSASIFSLLYALSIAASVVSLFLWKKYRLFYVPLLISGLTFAFLYYFWIFLPPTQTANLDNYRGTFYAETKVELPTAISNLKEYDDVGGIFGDGDTQLSFSMKANDLQQWMRQSGFTWKQGPSQKNGDTLNQFTDNGSVIFEDSPSVQYTVIDDTPNDTSTEYEYDTVRIYTNPTAGWVLIEENNV